MDPQAMNNHPHVVPQKRYTGIAATSKIVDPIHRASFTTWRVVATSRDQVDDASTSVWGRTHIGWRETRSR
jgi:hypothetical protein